MNRKSLFLTPFAFAVLTAGTASAAFLSVNLPGTTQNDGWSGMTGANYPAYSSASLGGPAGIWPAPFGSNTPGSGDALFSKTSGSGYFAGAGLYQAGGTGSFSVLSTTPVAGLKTLVFQLESNYDEAGGFAGGKVPELHLNGSATAIPATYTEYLLDAGAYLATNSIYAYQWDLSAVSGAITSFRIDWNGAPSSGQITGMELNQGSVMARVVPEPGVSLTVLAGAVGLLLRRRRSARDG